MKDYLGDRIKENYEDAYRIILPKRMPVICRVDGKSFHSYTKGLARPFDQNLIDCMNETAIYVCKNVQGCKLAYLQSDEISFVITNYDELNTEAFFNNNLQKMVSIIAAMTSSYFTSISDRIFGKIKVAQFDARAFVVPKEEVNNAILFRQQDATRNSLQMLAHSLYSHKELNNKKSHDLHEMCFQKGQNWNDLPTSQKRGRCVVRKEVVKDAVGPNSGTMTIRKQWAIDNEIPIFSQNTGYINDLINIKESI